MDMKKKFGLRGFLEKMAKNSIDLLNFGGKNLEYEVFSCQFKKSYAKAQRFVE